jgi:hypothetical protein
MDGRYKRILAWVAAGALLWTAAPAFAGQPLETETARLPLQGHGDAQFVFEYQTSSEGKESAFPLAFEYGITDRLELAVEPVVYTSIRQRGGPRAGGFGDTEATLTYLIVSETTSMPALAIAGEVKVPTTKDPIIGTGGTDFRVIGIASKRFGRVDVHANLGYTFVGGYRGSHLGNVFDYALAAEYILTNRVTLMSEVLGTLSSGKEDLPGSAQEAASNSVTGLLGAEYRLTPGLGIELGVTYDNNHAWLFRPAVTIRF